MPKRIQKSAFASGKVVNFKTTSKYIIEGIGEVTFKTDKNYSVYEVEPRHISSCGEHDLLTIVRGQVPNVAAQSLQIAFNKWFDDYTRYMNL